MGLVEVLCPVQQSGSYWDRSSALSLVGVEATQRWLPLTQESRKQFLVGVVRTR